MREQIILHLSDLHFGSHSAAVIDSFWEFKRRYQKPIHLSIVTGDITQRAKARQFIQARAFLEAIGIPVVCVPGNHDVPLFNLAERFFQPFHRYEKLMAPHFSDQFEDENLIILGIRTNNIFSISKGKASRSLVEGALHKFDGRKGKLKVLAGHHPLTSQEMHTIAELPREIQPDLFLSGHNHETSFMKWYPSRLEGPIFISAGTAISNRTRRERNSFNVITYDHSNRSGWVEHYHLSENKFSTHSRVKFEKV